VARDRAQWWVLQVPNFPVSYTRQFLHHLREPNKIWYWKKAVTILTIPPRDIMKTVMIVSQDNRCLHLYSNQIPHECKSEELSLNQPAWRDLHELRSNIV
jgi:hypothetical protein